MGYTLDLLKQFATGIARQFGPDCEVVIFDLKRKDIEHSIVFIENGEVSGRKIGEGTSRLVLEAVSEKNPSFEDHLGYLTRTDNGKVLRSSTFYIRNEDGQSVDYIVAINLDITKVIMLDRFLGHLTQETDENAGEDNEEKKPELIVSDVNDLLDKLIEQSVELVGKPVALMNKEEKVAAIRFLNEAGAFLITKSGDKVSKYFGISKYTLYSYIDVNK